MQINALSVRRILEQVSYSKNKVLYASKNYKPSNDNEMWMMYLFLKWSTLLSNIKQQMTLFISYGSVSALALVTLTVSLKRVWTVYSKDRLRQVKQACDVS